MAEPSRQMHLGVLALAAGNHVSGWRHRDAQAGAENLDLLRAIARTAERGKFDMLFLADAVNTGPRMHPSMMVRLEPLTLLAALAMDTTRVGLAATASTTYSEPYNLARALASVDHMSGGRCGWNVVTGAFSEAAANFSRDAHPSHADRYAIAAEHVQVCKGLWDSWEEDAIIMDKANGVFADTSKMHTLDHDGTYFKVKGPLNITRPPQGYPVLIQAGASEAGREFAASIAEVLFTVEQDMQAALALAGDIRERMRRYGRNPQDVKILPGIVPVVGSTEAEAREKLRELGELTNPDAAMKVLSERIGHDLSDFPLDEPLPDLPDSNIMQAHANVLKALARKGNMTLRELRDFAGVSMGHRLLVGTPDQVADGMEQWFLAGAADGYNVLPSYFPGMFDAFVDHVVPVLQTRGLFRTDYTGTTMREHLGLSHPPHPATLRGERKVSHG